MTHQKNDTQEETESQVSFEEMLREQLQQAIRKCSHRASGTELLKSDIISTGYGLPSISERLLCCCLKLWFRLVWRWHSKLLYLF